MSGAKFVQSSTTFRSSSCSRLANTLRRDITAPSARAPRSSLVQSILRERSSSNALSDRTDKLSRLQLALASVRDKSKSAPPLNSSVNKRDFRIPERSSRPLSSRLSTAVASTGTISCAAARLVNPPPPVPSNVPASRWQLAKERVLSTSSSRVAHRLPPIDPVPRRIVAAVPPVTRPPSVPSTAQPSRWQLAKERVLSESSIALLAARAAQRSTPVEPVPRPVVATINPNTRRPSVSSAAQPSRLQLARERVSSASSTSSSRLTRRPVPPVIAAAPSKAPPKALRSCLKQPGTTSSWKKRVFIRDTITVQPVTNWIIAGVHVSDKFDEERARLEADRERSLAARARSALRH